MRKILLGLLATAAIAAPVALATSANAAAPKPNHGQCVSSSVKAGVTGAAHIAIAQDNSLVGEYGTSGCPTIPPAGPVCTSSSVVTPTSADGDVKWILNDGTVTGTLKFHADATGGSVEFTRSGGDLTTMYNEDMDGAVTAGTFHRVPGENAVVFGGTVTNDGITDSDYLHNPMEQGNFFTAKVVDGGSVECNSDLVALLVNQVTPGVWITGANFDQSVADTDAYSMTKATAGVVTTGDVVIH